MVDLEGRRFAKDSKTPIAIGRSTNYFAARTKVNRVGSSVDRPARNRRLFRQGTCIWCTEIAICGHQSNSATCYRRADHKRASYRCRRLRYVFAEVCSWKRSAHRSPRFGARSPTGNEFRFVERLDDDDDDFGIKRRLMEQSRWNNSEQWTREERKWKRGEKGNRVENEGDAFAKRFCSSLLPRRSGKRGELTGEIECNRCNVRNTVGRSARSLQVFGNRQSPRNDGWIRGWRGFLPRVVRISRA